MTTREPSRRAFLINSVAGLGGAWVAANYAGIEAAEAYVAQAVRSGQAPALAFFTAEQAIEVEAMAAQIIPTDETPGAREARVVNFIDRALVTFERGRQADYTQGLKDLEAQTKQLVPGATRLKTWTSRVWPTRDRRPMRCSIRMGFQGRS